VARLVSSESRSRVMRTAIDLQVFPLLIQLLILLFLLAILNILLRQRLPVPFKKCLLLLLLSFIALFVLHFFIFFALAGRLKLTGLVQTDLLETCVGDSMRSESIEVEKMSAT
jgi:drug/metabolite transporter (DMT)-like permease